MKKPRIVIHVDGGRVDSVHSDTEIEVVIVDDDLLKDEDGLGFEERLDLLEEKTEGLQSLDMNFLHAPRYLNHYRHEDCPVQPGVEWEDEWSSMCNDRCPACNAEIEPYDSKELK